MAERSATDHEERGLSARQMVLILLVVVAVCAVFFAAGFVVGVNERSGKDTPTTETVQPTDVIPPTVNQPLEKPESSGTASAGAQKPQEPTPVKEEDLREPMAHTSRPATAPAKAATTAPKAATGNFAVQVAASSSREDAERVIKTLKGRGFPAYLSAPEKGGDNLYRVLVGPYPTREAAEQMKPRLEKEGFKQPFVKH